MARMSPERFVWLVTSPDGSSRIYIRQEMLERDLPQAARGRKKQVDNAGDEWEYGSKKIFSAKKLPIRDFEARPR